MQRATLGNPLIAMACVVLLGADAWLLRDTQGSGAGSVARWVTLGRARDWLPRSWGQIVLSQEETGMVLVDANGDGSVDALMRALNGNRGVVKAEYVIERETVGLWAPMLATDSHFLVLEPLIRTTPDAEKLAREHTVAAREAYARWLESNGWGDIAADVRRTPRRETEVLWGGVARNAGAMLLLAVLGMSVWSMRAWARERRMTKRRRSWARGVCAGCGYEVGKLMKCPECGGERVPA